MDTHAPFIVLKNTHMFMVTDDVQTMQREHLAIYVSLDEKNFHHSLMISAPSSMVL